MTVYVLTFVENVRDVQQSLISLRELNKFYLFTFPLVHFIFLLQNCIFCTVVVIAPRPLFPSCFEVAISRNIYTLSFIYF